MASLKRLRTQVDQLDQSLLDLLNQRGKLVQHIGVLKQKNGQSIFVPGRERALLSDLKSKNSGPLSNESVETLFREVIHACRNLQKHLTVAYFGPEASFSHAAALKSFGRRAPRSCLRVPFPKSLPKSIKAAQISASSRSKIPPAAASITRSTCSWSRLCRSARSWNCRCIIIYWAVPCAQKSIDKVKTLFSHYQALAQCRNWVDTHLPNARVVESTSTAEAAREAARTSGAVGHRVETGSRSIWLGHSRLTHRGHRPQLHALSRNRHRRASADRPRQNIDHVFD